MYFYEMSYTLKCSTNDFVINKMSISEMFFYEIHSIHVLNFSLRKIKFLKTIQNLPRCYVSLIRSKTLKILISILCSRIHLDKLGITEEMIIIIGGN